MVNKKGQVWIETVIYTLIGLALIGLVLAIITPRINQFQDRSAVEQSIDSLAVLDEAINDILVAPGNKRVVDITLKRGEIFFDLINDKIIWVISDSRSAYSEPGVSIDVGRINILTSELGDLYSVNMTLSYTHNLVFEDGSDIVKFSKSSIPHKFSFENQDFDPNNFGKFKINITEV